MTVRFEFGDDPEALARAMRLVLSWERPTPSPSLPADATSAAPTSTKKEKS